MRRTLGIAASIVLLAGLAGCLGDDGAPVGGPSDCPPTTNGTDNLSANGTDTTNATDANGTGNGTGFGTECPPGDGGVSGPY